ncbi:PREDICTED: uncharacterized protein LOC108556555 [Nicrophorus vespilloides]|uniref:Uncharacterized protein LOC108556555 n=1 Tax=Nicrophorus vespilloides TaxID=110193 RepID=A0ABM1M0W1_NICVS|nr:PREDICTED: uncharacterized protein LOC108556555 [Nicrophorus vespilloides]
MDCEDSKLVGETMSSKSRFGRTRKPKISHDFCNIDDLFTSPSKSLLRKQKSAGKRFRKSKSVSPKSVTHNYESLTKKRVSSELNFRRRLFNRPSSTSFEAKDADESDDDTNKFIDFRQVFLSSQKPILKTYSNRKSIVREKPEVKFPVPDESSNTHYIQELDVQANTDDVNIHENKFGLCPWESLGEAETSNVPLEDLFIKDDELEFLFNEEDNTYSTESFSDNDIPVESDINTLESTEPKMIGNDVVSPRNNKRSRKKQQTVETPKTKNVASPKPLKSRSSSKSTKEVLSDKRHLKSKESVRNKSDESELVEEVLSPRASEKIEQEILSPRALRAIKKKQREDSLESEKSDNQNGKEVEPKMELCPLRLESKMNASPKRGRAKSKKMEVTVSAALTISKNDDVVNNPLVHERLNQNCEQQKSEENENPSENTKFEDEQSKVPETDKNDETTDKSDNKILEIDKKLNIDTKVNEIIQYKTEYNGSHSYNSNTSHVDLNCTKEKVEKTALSPVDKDNLMNGSSDIQSAEEPRQKDTLDMDLFPYTVLSDTTKLAQTSTPKKQLICKINIDNLTSIIYKDHNYFLSKSNASSINPAEQESASCATNSNAIELFSPIVKGGEASSRDLLQESNDSNESINLEKIFKESKTESKEKKPKVLVEVLNEDMYSLPERTTFMRNRIEKKSKKLQLEENYHPIIKHSLEINENPEIELLNNNDKVLIDDDVCSIFPPHNEIKFKLNEMVCLGKTILQEDDEMIESKRVEQNESRINIKDPSTNMEQPGRKSGAEKVDNSKKCSISNVRCAETVTDENVLADVESKSAENVVMNFETINTQDILSEIEKILEPSPPNKKKQEVSTSAKENLESNKEDKENLARTATKPKAVESPRNRKSRFLIDVNPINKETYIPAAEKGILIQAEAEFDTIPIRNLRSRKTQLPIAESTVVRSEQMNTSITREESESIQVNSSVVEEVKEIAEEMTKVSEGNGIDDDSCKAEIVKAKLQSEDDISTFCIRSLRSGRVMEEPNDTCVKLKMEDTKVDDSTVEENTPDVEIVEAVTVRVDDDIEIKINSDFTFGNLKIKKEPIDVDMMDAMEENELTSLTTLVEKHETQEKLDEVAEVDVLDKKKVVPVRNLRMRKSLVPKESPIEVDLAVNAADLNKNGKSEEVEIVSSRTLRSRKSIVGDAEKSSQDDNIKEEQNSDRRKSLRARKSVVEKKKIEERPAAKKRKLDDSVAYLNDIMDDVEYIKNSLKIKPEVARKRIKLDPDVVIKKEMEDEDVMPSSMVKVEIKQEPGGESCLIPDAHNDDDEILKILQMCLKGMHKFKMGELAYARLGKCVYWPSLIIKDPCNDKFTIAAPDGKPEHLQYHVRFFGDRGRRSWVRICSMLPFTVNLPEIYNIFKRKKASERLAPIDHFKVSRFPKWFRGMQEAMPLIDKPLEEKQDFFQLVIEQDTEKRSKIRKGRSEARIKQEVEEEESECNSVEESLDSDANYSLRKRTSEIKQESSESSVEEVKEDNEVCSESSETDLISPKWTLKPPLVMNKETQTALWRRNNIFRGVRRDRVCQICYLPEDVLKCRGKCSGYYHRSCASDLSRIIKVVRKGKLKMVNENTGNEVEVVSIKTKKYQSPKKLSLDKEAVKDLTLLEQFDLKMKEVMNPIEEKTIYADSTTDNSSEDSSSQQIEILESSLKNTDEFRCGKCLANIDPPCHMCGCNVSPRGSSARQRCTVVGCGKTFHQECLRLWPQTQFSLIKSSNNEQDAFYCPMHTCQICVSDNPRTFHARITTNKIARCLKCPATYHNNSRCIPAGSNVITASQIICPRHYVDSKQTTVNTTWCFICSKGGALICCEICPTSVHSECSSINYLEDGSYVCEDCESGRLPLYDEIVWAKLGSYRWWPALVLFPNEIPENVMNSSHHQGQFVVRFFGTHDHYWIGRGRVFLFQADDVTVSTNRYRSRVDFVYQQAVKEAAEAHRFKLEYKDSCESLLKDSDKPPTFIKIKINKPVGNVKLGDASNTSNAMACTCDPDGPSPCGESSDCLNRMLLTECDLEVCPAGERCENQRFDKRQYVNVLPYNTKGRGWGLKTLEPVKKGQFVIEYVGEVIDDKEYQRRIKKMHEQKIDNYYFLTIDNTRMIDAGPKGNVARFMNHCCEPNCETQKWTVRSITRIGLFAIQDIPKDTELTFNYNFQCVGEEKKECRCGAPSCSGFIGAKKSADVKKQKKPSSIKVSTPSPVESPVEEEPCFECGETGLGETYPCHSKLCTKFYHPKCVNLETKMHSKWTCPWHNCNMCSKRTIRCCLFCTNSYCPLHCEGKMRHDRMLGYVCFSHDPEREVANHDEGLQKSKSPTDESDVTSTTYEADDSASSIAEDSCHATTTTTVVNSVKGKKRRRSSRTSLNNKKRSKTEGPLGEN